MASRTRPRTTAKPKPTAQPAPQQWRRGQGGLFDVVKGGWDTAVLPFVVFVLVVPLLGLGWHALAVRFDYVPHLTFMLGACGAALTVALWRSSQSRNPWNRRRLALSIGWLAAVWSVTTLIGAVPFWHIVLVLPTGCLIALWHVVVQYPVHRGDGTDHHGDEDGAWQRAVGLADSTRPVKAEDKNGERHVLVEHTENTREDLVRAKQRIEAKAKLPSGSVRIDPVLEAGRTLAHRTKLVISRSAYLDNVPDWKGPVRAGAGVWEPIRVGWTADRKESRWSMTPTDDFVGSPSLISSGKSGAAKTAFQVNLLGELVARQGIVVIASDTRKAGQWVPFVRPFLHWFESTPEGAEAQLRALAAAVPVRTQLITDLTGEDRWTPRCWTEFGIPFVLAWFAEAAPLMGPFEEEWARGVEVWRSAGFKVVTELQRPSEENVSTDFRNLVPESMAFACDKPEDARMALSEDTLDAGAEPWTFDPMEQPGLHYAELAGEKKNRWPMKRRTERPDRLLLAATVAEWMVKHPEWHELDQATAEVFAGAATRRASYARRDVVTVGTWLSSKYGKVPQLRDPAVRKWIEQAPKPTPPTPTPPTPAGPPAQQEEPVHPDEETEAAPDLALAELEEDDDTMSEHMRQQVALESDLLDDEIDAEVTHELGPDPDETPDPRIPVERFVAQVDGPQDGDDDPAVDWSLPASGPRPSPQQRAANFQAMVRRLFTETDPAQHVKLSDGERVPPGEVQAGPDGTRWVRVSTETLVALWLDFPGEDVRPALYPRLEAHTKTRPGRPATARQLARGEWAISEHVLDEPLVIPDDYDPADEDGDELDEARDDAALRDVEALTA